jgi:hypothetical protein
MFHTVDFFALTVCLATFFPVFNYILAGCLFHMACDMIYLLRNNHFFVRAYSLFEYMYRSRTGCYVLSVKNLVEKHEPDISGISGIRFWLRKWGWKQDGVIDAKPDFFAGWGNRTEKWSETTCALVVTVSACCIGLKCRPHFLLKNRKKSFISLTQEK